MNQVHAVRGSMNAMRKTSLEIRMTPLDKPLRRELVIDGRLYTLTIDPGQLKLVEKGRRKGIELAWPDLVNGDAALATALQASLARLR
jgi:hypothetical protein